MQALKQRVPGPCLSPRNRKREILMLGRPEWKGNWLLWKRWVCVVNGNRSCTIQWGSVGAVGDEDGDQAINLEGSLRVKKTRREGAVCAVRPADRRWKEPGSMGIWGRTHSGFEGWGYGGSFLVFTGHLGTGQLYPEQLYWPLHWPSRPANPVSSPTRVPPQILQKAKLMEEELPLL